MCRHMLIHHQFSILYEPNNDEGRKISIFYFNRKHRITNTTSDVGGSMFAAMIMDALKLKICKNRVRLLIYWSNLKSYGTISCHWHAALGLGHEAMVCAVCLSIFLWNSERDYVYPTRSKAGLIHLQIYWRNWACNKISLGSCRPNQIWIEEYKICGGVSLGLNNVLTSITFCWQMVQQV